MSYFAQFFFPPAPGHQIQFSTKSCSEEKKKKMVCGFFIIIIILSRGGSVTHWEEGDRAGWVGGG